MAKSTKYQRTLFFEPEHELLFASLTGVLDRHVAPYHDEWEKDSRRSTGVWLGAGKQGFGHGGA